MYKWKTWQICLLDGSQGASLDSTMVSVLFSIHLFIIDYDVSSYNLDGSLVLFQWEPREDICEDSGWNFPLLAFESATCILLVTPYFTKPKCVRLFNLPFIVKKLIIKKNAHVDRFLNHSAFSIVWMIEIGPWRSEADS